jgi:hypothetical protein
LNGSGSSGGELALPRPLRLIYTTAARIVGLSILTVKELSPKLVATAAKRPAKCLILLVGDPANREINREFRQIRSLCGILKANT